MEKVSVTYIARVWKTGTSLVVTLDSLAVVKKLGIDNDDEVLIEIKNVIKKYQIPIKCPKCSEIFVVNKNKDVVDCPNCSQEIQNVDFDEVYVNDKNRLLREE